MEIDKKSEEITERNRFVLALGVGVVALQVVIGFAVYYAFDDWSARGTFGDMFGAVNSLFSGLAFAGVIYAILLQRRELSLQRLELELTRRELERAANAQERSTQLLESQLEVMRHSHKLEENRALAEMEPFFRHDGGSRTPRKAIVKFINEGGEIKDLQITPQGEFDVRVTPTALVKRGGSGQIEIHYGRQSKPPFIVTIGYTDLIGIRTQISLACDPDNGRISLIKE